jgi:hypothetical protein
MALGSTQPLIEMSTRNLPGGKGRSARKVDKFNAICEPTLVNAGAPTACYTDSFAFIQLRWSSRNSVGHIGGAIVSIITTLF